MCTCAHLSASPLSAAMALRRFGVGPSAANANAALRETEKATAERDAEARAAFEATFKRAHRVPPTLAPTGRRVRDAKQFDRFDDDATAREAMRARGVDPDALGTTRAIGPATRGSGYARGVADPRRTTARGAGVGGGAAGRESGFTVSVRDGEGERTNDGAHRVTFEVVGREGEVVAAGEGRDEGDGEHACAYAVRERGEYRVTVRMDGVEIEGSPFEVFYSAPLDGPLVNERRARGVPLLARGEPAPAGVCRDFLLGNCDRVICKFKHDVPPPPPPPPPGASGGDAVGVVNVPPPPVPEELRRTAHVSNYPVGLTTEQVKQLFSFCGSIAECREGGPGKNFCFIEFESNKEALAACALNGMQVGGRNLRVELAKTPKLLNPRSFSLAPAPAKVDIDAKAAQSEAAARAAAISARLAAKGGSSVRHKPY